MKTTAGNYGLNARVDPAGSEGEQIVDEPKFIR
jgi:hypothetical protein